MINNKFRVIVIDDEEDIRNILEESISESMSMKLIGAADSVKTGFQLITEEEPDIVFLDIKLKGGDAFQLLNLLKSSNVAIPAVILNTGFADFELAQRTINEFRDDVLMILKKPFWENWIEKESLIISKTIERIRKNPNDKPDHEINADKITIKSENMTYIVWLSELILIETDPNSKGKNKANLYLYNRDYCINSSLSKLETQLNNDFIRISRYSIVNKHFIRQYNHTDQTLTLKNLENKVIYTGSKYRDELYDFLELK
ncbi:MAG: response regulator transcription factor [Saprospiraceae bacterium]|nr:response regulator transcription factor [Saprospiraceae bacterium]